jgi:hypothetical protein
MDICFEGVGQVAATFKVDSSKAVLPGMAVTLTADGTVGLGSAGNMPCGVLLGGVRGGAAAVQISGVAKVGCSDAAPRVGWQTLACDGKGGVKTVTTGGLNCLVLAVDEDETGKSVIVKL